MSSQSWAVHAANLSCLLLKLKRSSPFRPDLALTISVMRMRYVGYVRPGAPRANSRALVITSGVCELGMLHKNAALPIPVLSLWFGGIVDSNWRAGASRSTGTIF